MLLINDVSNIDLQKVIAIDEAFLNYAWSVDQWKDFQASYHDCTYLQVMKSDEDIKSFALYMFSKNEGVLHLLKIVTAMHYRRQGMGKDLIISAIEWLEKNNGEKIVLEVAVNNSSAIKLYENLGFETIGVRKKFYSDGCDALSMQLKIA